jgi:hypothetical protein
LQRKPAPDLDGPGSRLENPAEVVLVLVAVKIGGTAGVDGLADATMAVGDFAYCSIVYAIGAVLIGVVYRDLRVAREGVGDETGTKIKRQQF